MLFMNSINIFQGSEHKTIGSKIFTRQIISLTSYLFSIYSSSFYGCSKNSFNKQTI